VVHLLLGDILGHVLLRWPPLSIPLSA